MLGLRFRTHPRHGNLGYWLGRPAWGRGLATEAVALACHLAFEHCFCIRADAFTRVENAASQRVLEKCGFHLDGTLRANVQKDGAWHDEAFYTLLRKEWEAAPRLPVTLEGTLPGGRARA